MIKYELYTDTFEFRTRKGQEWQSDDIFDAYITQGDLYPTRVAQADNLEDIAALFEDEKLKCTTYEQAYTTGWLIRGVLCYIEIAEYDEDGEYIQGGDIVKFCVVPFRKEEEAEEDA